MTCQQAHHFLLASPAEGVTIISGRCKRCGAQREWPAVPADKRQRAGSPWNRGISLSKKGKQ